MVWFLAKPGKVDKQMDKQLSALSFLSGALWRLPCWCKIRSGREDGSARIPVALPEDCGLGISISVSPSSFLAVLLCPRERTDLSQMLSRTPRSLLGHRALVLEDFLEFPRLISCHTTRPAPAFLCCSIINLAKLGHF